MPKLLDPEVKAKVITAIERGERYTHELGVSKQTFYDWKMGRTGKQKRIRIRQSKFLICPITGFTY